MPANETKSPQAINAQPQRPFNSRHTTYALYTLHFVTFLGTGLFWWTKRTVFQIIYTVSILAHLVLVVWLQREAEKLERRRDEERVEDEEEEKGGKEERFREGEER
jgi:L-asparagine transporter-like permease